MMRFWSVTWRIGLAVLFIVITYEANFQHLQDEKRYKMALCCHVLALVRDQQRVLFIGTSQTFIPQMRGEPYRLKFATKPEQEKYIAQHGTEGHWVEATP